MKKLMVKMNLESVINVPSDYASTIIMIYKKESYTNENATN